MTASAAAAGLRSAESGAVIRGVVTLLFTPFTDDGRRFDAASMRRQLDYVLEGGVSAVVACGKAGEFEGQALEEIEEVLATVLEHVDGRVPVGMGIISVEEDGGLPAAELAAGCGADFAMAKKLTKAGLHGFFSQIAERIPVMLYDQTNEGTLDVDDEVLPLVAAIERIMTVKVSGNVYSFDHLKSAAPAGDLHLRLGRLLAARLRLRQRRRRRRQRRRHARPRGGAAPAGGGRRLGRRPAPVLPAHAAHDRLLHPRPLRLLGVQAPPALEGALRTRRWCGRPTSTRRSGCSGNCASWRGSSVCSTGPDDGGRLAIQTRRAVESDIPALIDTPRRPRGLPTALHGVQRGRPSLLPRSWIQGGEPISGQTPIRQDPRHHRHGEGTHSSPNLSRRSMTSPLRADSYPACTMARLRRSLRPDVGHSGVSLSRLSQLRLHEPLQDPQAQRCLDLRHFRPAREVPGLIRVVHARRTSGRLDPPR